MKKTSLLLSALLAVALTACGKQEAPAPVAAPAPAAQPAAPVQEAVVEKAEEAANAAEETASQGSTALDAAVEKARETADQAREAIGAASEAAVETAKELTEDAKSAIESATEVAGEKATAAVAAVTEALSPAAPAALSAADAENLAKAKNCMACHATDRKLVGPSYKEVAEKRASEADAVAVIAAKIRAGGSGVYGPVPMPPNPQVSEVEAAQLAQWVLSIK